MTPIRLSNAVDTAIAATPTDELTVTLTADGQIEADSTRFEKLLQNAVELAVQTDANELVVGLSDTEVTLAYTGEDVLDFEISGLLVYGEAVPHSKAGMNGPNIETLAQAQGWSVTVEDREPGFALRLTGVGRPTEGEH
jgi:hypothetical protein